MAHTARTISRRCCSEKHWVLIQHNNGTVEAWRDYGTAWGSPAYTVIDYHTGTHREALACARWHLEQDTRRAHLGTLFDGHGDEDYT